MNRLWIAGLLLLARHAAANDTLATLGAGGLVPVKSSQIAMEREDLEISVHQISVRYLFRNLSDKDVDAVVEFPLPDLEGGLVEHEPLQLPDRAKANFVDFEVTVAGKTVAAKMEVRAIHEGRDITERLRVAGIPASVIDAGLEAAVGKLSAQQRAQFRKDELLVTDEPGAKSPRYWAWWTTKVQFYWTQHFPARGTVEVRHKYRPVVGGNCLITSRDVSSAAKPFCESGPKLEEERAFLRRHPGKSADDFVMCERTVQYILTTANNWSGPIRDFHLSVVADGSDDIVLTCMPGLKRIAPTRYELARSNFHPDRELDLLILQPK